MTTKKEYNRIYKIGYDNARIEIKKFIETERDKGNMVSSPNGTTGFSAGLCLSKLLKELNEDIDKSSGGTKNGNL